MAEKYNKPKFDLIAPLTDSERKRINSCIPVNMPMSDSKIYTITEIKEITNPIFNSKPFVEKVYLFGSYARGEATSKSDLDFMVCLNQKVGVNFFGLYDLLQDALGKKVDVLTETECIEIMPKSIKRDKVMIYER